MNKTRAIKEIENAFPGEMAKVLVPLLRPNVRLIAGNGEASLKGSRFGGEVLLPAETAWPAWDPSEHLAPLIQLAEEEVRKIKAAQTRRGETEPRHYASRERWLEKARGVVARGPRRMNFLAQICLSDLSGLECGIELPKHGSLSLFYDTELKPGGQPWSRDGWRVIYSPGGEEKNLGWDRHAAWREKCLPMAFEEAWTLPTDPARAGADIALDEAYDFLSESLRGERDQTHHLGGWADEIQGDASPPQARRGDGEWVLLLQLASDDPRNKTGLGWMWGDGGTLYFWIRREDLAAQHFGRVWCGIQMS